MSGTVLLFPRVLDGCAGFGYTLVDFLESPLVEEFHEAYVPAESAQEGKNARFSQAHEYGRRSEGDLGPPQARPATAGRLIFAAE